MLISKNRESQIDVRNIRIQIGESMYLLTESNDGRLNINKTSLSDNISISELLLINPRSGNEIELF